MILRVASSPFSSLLQPFNLPAHYAAAAASSSSSYSQVPLVLRSQAPALRWGCERLGPVRCSVSQVHSYGTIDYERRPALRWNSVYRRISTMEDPGLGSAVVLDQCEEEEDKRLTKWALCRVAKELRKFRRYKNALEVYEWMTAHGNRFPFNSSDMAIQLDLISKVHGVSRAEEYFSALSSELKDKRTYGALLNAYGKARMKENAEDLLNTMKAKGFADDSLPFNVMMTLYLNLGEYEKVYSIVTEMKERNVTFDIYSYNIWITTCASMEDMEEMEKVVERMISDTSINPNWTTYSTLTSMYMKVGNFEKAEKCLKEVELRVTGRDRTPFHYLLGYYSRLGKAEEVHRVWNWYKSSFPSILNWGYHAMLTSLVRLDDIDGAEAIYDEWLSTTLNYDVRISHILMVWYARKGLLYKAKAVLDLLVGKGGKPRPVTLEILAEGYVKEKQISKAVSCLNDAASGRGAINWKPKPETVANIVTLCKELGKVEEMDLLVDVLRNQGWLEEEEYKSLISS